MTAQRGYAGNGERATRIVGLVGNPRAESRTHGLSRSLIRALGRVITGSVTSEVDLTSLAPRVLDPSAEVVSAALEQVQSADILVVASPTYKAAYSGLLKAFLDRFGNRPLVGTAAVPVLLGGAPDHLLAVDVHFTPLLLELGALVPARGLFVLESDVAGFDEFAANWAETHAHLLLAASRAGVSPPVTA
ncbi:MAG: NAD(P)H-dependent oxidoreductase [Streptosporangiaceae bacterium]|nr:NAD(P)H-dependent oxidoreductase [Streptosporangiaceae bacterium]MBV9854892.1 NAD(P)H-dependent oxidoreductase [Streptosporangiaceae bacterium]